MGKKSDKIFTATEVKNICIAHAKLFRHHLAEDEEDELNESDKTNLENLVNDAFWKICNYTS